MTQAPPPHNPSFIAALGAGVVGLLVIIFLFAGFHHNEVPDWDVSEVKAPTLRHETPRPWVDEKGFNLPPAGALPSLQSAMRDNKVLRDKVIEFSQKDDAELFANFKQTDADIAAILILWGGGTETGKTHEGIDRRVDKFIRRVYAMGNAEPIVNNPRLGRDPWPRLFAHYKVRLVAQAAGGGAPFTGGIAYDFARDRLRAPGGINRDFLAAFGGFLKTRRDAALFRNNLLSYIEATGVPLDDADRKLLQTF